MIATHVTADFSFYNEEIKTLFHLVDRCLSLTHNEDSEFRLDSDEYVLFGKIIKNIESNNLLMLHIGE